MPKKHFEIGKFCYLHIHLKTDYAKPEYLLFFFFFKKRLGRMKIPEKVRLVWRVVGHPVEGDLSEQLCPGPSSLAETC